MKMRKGFVGELIDSDAIGISHVDGQWRLLGKGNYIRYWPGVETETPEQSFQHFVEALRSANRSGDFTQIIFRRVEEIGMFLALDAPRLREVQDYVRSVRRGRNLVVTSVLEILKLIGGGAVPAEDTLWLDGLSMNDFALPAHGVSPLLSMSPSYLLSLDSWPGEQRDVSQFHFDRYLANSDLLISALESPSEHGAPLAVDARGSHDIDLAKAYPDVTTFLIANVDDPRRSFLTGPVFRWLPEESGRGWRVVPLGCGFDTFCWFRATAPEAKNVMPLDVLAAI